MTATTLSQAGEVDTTMKFAVENTKFSTEQLGEGAVSCNILTWENAQASYFIFEVNILSYGLAEEFQGNGIGGCDICSSSLD